MILPSYKNYSLRVYRYKDMPCSVYVWIYLYHIYLCTYVNMYVYFNIYIYFNHLCQRNIALDGIKQTRKNLFKIIEVGIKTTG